MIEMKLYRPNKDYLIYLASIDDKIINSKNIIGVPLRLNELIYFLPITSPIEGGFDDGKSKKSSPTIMKMIDVKNGTCYGRCLFSNMFAIPYKELEVIDISNFEQDKMILMEKKLEFIRKNQKRILKSANMIFKQKIKNYDQRYLKATVNFTKIEEAALRWEIQKYGKHYNSFPDQIYFLTNPNTEGISEYYLMNKKMKVAKISFDNATQKVDRLIEIFNEEYAPFECFYKGELSSEEITTWFKGRGIPSWRDGLDDLLENLGIKDKDVLLNKAYGLSLSDQYWLNPVERYLDWDDINFFDHDFNSRDFVEASFDDKFIDNNVDFYSPNNTSDGMLKKAWIVGNDKKRYLLKSSFKQKGLEPFNEILSGMIAEVIGLKHVSYTIEIMSKTALSKCECFIDKETEFISAYAVLRKMETNMKDDEILIMKKYVDILSKNGIDNVEEKLAKMFILDYLMINQDRHLGNFGIVRNVDSLRWLDVAPNFDSGQSMCSQKDVYEMNFENAFGCFFNHKNIDFEGILDYALKLCPKIEVDFIKLQRTPFEWKKELLKYQYVSLIDDEKIDILIEGLKLRISKLKNKLIDNGLT